MELMRRTNLTEHAHGECGLIPRHVSAVVRRQGMMIRNTLEAGRLLIEGLAEIASVDGKEYAAVVHRRKRDEGQTCELREACGTLTARNSCRKTETKRLSASCDNECPSQRALTSGYCMVPPRVPQAAAAMLWLPTYDHPMTSSGFPPVRIALGFSNALGGRTSKVLVCMRIEPRLHLGEWKRPR